MTLAAIKLFLTGLPWRWIGLAALLFGIWMHGYTFADNRADKRIEAAKAEYIKANKIEQDKAEARLADQRFNAELVSKQVLNAETEFNQMLKGKQNELRKAAASLAECRLSRDVVRLLNDARQDTVSPD